MSKMIVELFAVIAIAILIVLVSVDAEASTDMKPGFVCTTRDAIDLNIKHHVTNAHKAGYAHGAKKTAEYVIKSIKSKCKKPGDEVIIIEGLSLICK